MVIWGFQFDGLTWDAIATVWLPLVLPILAILGLICGLVWRESIISAVKYVKGLRKQL